MPAGPFDAVLVIAFGGPQGPADIRPFLRNVLRGRSVPPERVEEVVRHYERFGGLSPLGALTRRQAEGLRQRLDAEGPALPVFVGMRNWHPFLADTLRDMSQAGARRAIGFIAAAHRSYSSCAQYRQNVLDARAEQIAAGRPDVQVTYVGDWHTHPGFLEANARRARLARERLPTGVRSHARLVFTAHSIPAALPGAATYARQLRESAAGVAARADMSDWALVYQSRSGRPADPWLGPDVNDYLRSERERRLAAVVLCPLGFLCDHIEVLYDLDEEAAGTCRELGLPMARAEAVNDDSLFLDVMADVVRQTWDRYRGGLPLPLAPTAPPLRIEGPPPTRDARAAEISPDPRTHR